MSVMLGEVFTNHDLAFNRIGCFRTDGPQYVQREAELFSMTDTEPQGYLVRVGMAGDIRNATLYAAYLAVLGDFYVRLSIVTRELELGSLDVSPTVQEVCRQTAIFAESNYADIACQTFEAFHHVTMFSKVDSRQQLIIGETAIRLFAKIPDCPATG